MIVRAIIVMGVSGSGKSALGRSLAERLGYRFIEGDDLHASASIAKMAAGIPLNDEDRWPWLDKVADALDAASAKCGGVAACSALKRSYRDRLRDRIHHPVAIIHPVVAYADLRDRLLRRRAHHMPMVLLASQCDALEAPAQEENVIAVDGGQSTEAQLGLVLRHMHQAG